MKWRLCLIAVVFLAALLLCLPAIAETQSGTCGDNLTWTLDDEGTLTISGTGNMYDYGYTLINDSNSTYNVTAAPWSVAPVRVILKNGITSIGKNAFFRCTKLSSVTISNSVTTIKDRAFSNCNSLTNITLPDSITDIGISAFSGCKYLTSIILPDGITNIGNSAFSGCTNLTSITIPEGVAIINKETFRDCTNLSKISISSTVTNIGWYAFYNCTSLISITFPDGVSKIDAAFVNCPAIKYAHLDTDSARTLSKMGFTFRVPETNYDLQYLFTDNEVSDLRISNVEKDVTSFIIPNCVTIIGNEAFKNCSSLTSVSFSDNITSIESYAFSNCSKLNNINIPKKVTSIGDYAFNRCFNLENITFPNGLLSIGNYVFQSCSNLTSITIPDSVICIGVCTFDWCLNLTEFVILGEDTIISSNAFGDVTNVMIHCLEGSQAQVYAETHYIPYTLISVPASAVLILPTNLTIIESEAFAGLNVDVIVIPASVQSIALDAFSDTNAVLSVTPGSYAETWAKDNGLNYRTE